jgi:hypothetical protein
MTGKNYSGDPVASPSQSGRNHNGPGGAAAAPEDIPPNDTEGGCSHADDHTLGMERLLAAYPDRHCLAPVNDTVRGAGAAIQRAIKYWRAANPEQQIDHVDVVGLLEQALERLEWVDRYTCAYAHTYPAPKLFSRSKPGKEPVTVRKTATIPIKRKRKWWKWRHDPSNDGPSKIRVDSAN